MTFTKIHLNQTAAASFRFVRTTHLNGKSTSELQSGSSLLPNFPAVNKSKYFHLTYILTGQSHEISFSLVSQLWQRNILYLSFNDAKMCRKRVLSCSGIFDVDIDDGDEWVLCSCQGNEIIHTCCELLNDVNCLAMPLSSNEPCLSFFSIPRLLLHAAEVQGYQFYNI